jgi:transposase-like protein
MEPTMSGSGVEAGGGTPLGGVVRIDDGRIQAHLDAVVRSTVEEALNALLDAEVDHLCGARKYERTEGRKDTRAGSYTRQLHTRAGEVSLQVPKLRSLPFETAIIERYRRRESSVEEALIEMYLAGVSVRRVEDITQALWGTRVSASTVSDLNQKIYGKIEEWRQQPLVGEFPYVFLDGLWLKRSWGGEVKNVSVLVAIGVSQTGESIFAIAVSLPADAMLAFSLKKRPAERVAPVDTYCGNALSRGPRRRAARSARLSCNANTMVSEGAKEDKASWTNFLREMKQRGLKGVQLFVSDKCLGLVENLADFYPEAKWQRCVVHFYRNVWTAVPTGKGKEVAAMLKAVHAQEDRQAAKEKARQIVDKLRAMKLIKAAELVENGIDETLSYYELPPEHWRCLRTNNPLERLMREIRRRTRVVGAFPDGKSALMLVAARLRHVAGTRWGAKRYLQMNRLAEVVAIA